MLVGENPYVIFLTVGVIILIQRTALAHRV